MKKSSLPSVSVIIPTHDSKDSLVAVLSYLNKQTYPRERFEVIVVDDGSTDGTREKVQEISHAFSLKYFYQSRKRQAAARNFGIGHAGGEYILFIDSDVIPSFNLIEAHVEMHRKFPKSVVQGEVVPSPGTSLIDAINMNEVFLDRGFKHGQAIGFEAITCNLSVKRRYLQAVKGFNEGFDCYGCEDIELGFRLVTQAGLVLRYSKEAVGYSYREIGFEERAQKQWENGKSFVRLFRLHPEIAHPENLKGSGKRLLNTFCQGMRFKPLTEKEITERKTRLLKLEDQNKAGAGEFARVALTRLYKELFAYAIGEGIFCELNRLEKTGSVFSVPRPSPDAHLMGMTVRWLIYEDQARVPFGVEEMFGRLGERGFVVERRVVPRAANNGKAPEDLSADAGAITIHYRPTRPNPALRISDYNVLYWDDVLPPEVHALLGKLGQAVDEIWVPSESLRAKLKALGVRPEIRIVPTPVSWRDCFSLQKAKPFEAFPGYFVFCAVAIGGNAEKLDPYLAAYMREFSVSDRVIFLILAEEQKGGHNGKAPTSDQSPPVIKFTTGNPTMVLQSVDCYVCPDPEDAPHIPLVGAFLLGVPVVARCADGEVRLLRGDPDAALASLSRNGGKRRKGSRPGREDHIGRIRAGLREAFKGRAPAARGAGTSVGEVAERFRPESAARHMERILHAIYSEQFALRMHVFQGNKH